MKEISKGRADHLNNAEIDRLHFSSIDSTNSWARRNADRLDPTKITLITASQQTEGRGRLKRAWHSPADCNVYLSFCFFVDVAIDISNIGQVMSMAAFAALEELGVSIALKWPNDLMLNGKKCGGILCETTPFEQLRCVIVGLGLNVNMELADLKKVDQPATSIFESTETHFNVDQVIILLQKHFKNSLVIYMQEGFAPFYKAYCDLNAALIGKMIGFQSHQQPTRGAVKAIRPDGSLEIISDSGESKVCTPGEIFLK
jgi:BirA family biotin operon repressor/biotin-[acetyl-CoA-carboxylase] ligase